MIWYAIVAWAPRVGIFDGKGGDAIQMRGIPSRKYHDPSFSKRFADLMEERTIEHWLPFRAYGPQVKVSTAETRALSKADPPPPRSQGRGGRAHQLLRSLHFPPFQSPGVSPYAPPFDGGNLPAARGCGKGGDVSPQPFPSRQPFWPLEARPLRGRRSERLRTNQIPVQNILGIGYPSRFRWQPSEAQRHKGCAGITEPVPSLCPTVALFIFPPQACRSQKKTHIHSFKQKHLLQMSWVIVFFLGA